MLCIIFNISCDEDIEKFVYISKKCLKYVRFLGVYDKCDVNIEKIYIVEEYEVRAKKYVSYITFCYISYSLHFAIMGIDCKYI